MRLPEPARMAEDGGQPVWARARRRRGNPILNFVGFVLALVGLLTLVLAAAYGGFGKGGAEIDSVIGSAVSAVTGAKAKTTSMDASTPTEPASAPAQPAASSSPASSAANP